MINDNENPEICRNQSIKEQFYVVLLDGVINIVRKYRDTRHIAIVVLRPLKTITPLRRGKGVTYSMTLCNN